MKVNKIKILGKGLVAFMLFISASFMASADQANVHYIEANEAHSLLKEASKDIVVLDIRTAEEFEAGHIEDAVNIDFYSDEFREDLSKLDKSKTYLVYCRSGGRSQRSLSTFNELSFENIVHLNGGYKSWVKRSSQ